MDSEDRDNNQAAPPMYHIEMYRRYLIQSKNSNQLVLKNEDTMQSFPEDKTQVFGFNSNPLLPTPFEAVKQQPMQDCYTDSMSGYSSKSGPSHPSLPVSTSNVQATDPSLPVFKINASNNVQKYSLPSQTHSISYNSTVSCCQASDFTQALPRYQNRSSAIFPMQNSNTSESARSLTSRQYKGVAKAFQLQRPYGDRLAETLPIQNRYESKLQKIHRINNSFNNGLAEIHPIKNSSNSGLTEMLQIQNSSNSGLTAMSPIQNSYTNESARTLTSHPDRGVVEEPQIQSAYDGRLVETLPIQNSYESRLEKIHQINYSSIRGLAEKTPIQNSYTSESARSLASHPNRGVVEESQIQNPYDGRLAETPSIQNSYESRLDEIYRIPNSSTSGIAEIPPIQNLYDNIEPKIYPNKKTLNQKFSQGTITFSSFKQVKHSSQESDLSRQHFENEVLPAVYDQYYKLDAGGNLQEIPSLCSSHDPLTEAIFRGISVLQQREKDWLLQQSQNDQTRSDSQDKPINDLSEHSNDPLTYGINKGISLLKSQKEQTRSQSEDEPTNDLNKRVNVFVLGSKGSGKKFLLKRFLSKFVDLAQNEDFSQGLTVQLKVSNRDMHTTFTIIKNLCDCLKIIDMTCNGGQCCLILVYNLVQTSSLQEVHDFVKKNEKYLMKSGIPIVLAGNTMN